MSNIIDNKIQVVLDDFDMRFKEICMENEFSSSYNLLRKLLLNSFEEDGVRNVFGLLSDILSDSAFRDFESDPDNEIVKNRMLAALIVSDAEYWSDIGAINSSERLQHLNKLISSINSLEFKLLMLEQGTIKRRDM